MVLSGFASVAGLGAIAVTMLIGIFIWYKGFNKYYSFVKRDAYKVLDTGMLPTEAVSYTHLDVYKRQFISYLEVYNKILDFSKFS